MSSLLYLYVRYYSVSLELGSGVYVILHGTNVWSHEFDNNRVQWALLEVFRPNL